MNNSIFDRLSYLSDILDILIVAGILYYIYVLLRRTRGVPVLIGLGILLGIALIAQISNLETLGWLFEMLSNYFVIAILIILQPEMRRLFYRVGEGSWFRNFYTAPKVNTEEIVQAVSHLFGEKTGALIVIINKIDLEQVLEGGVAIHAKLSKELLLSIFYKKNPLHDGAICISGDMIVSAATYLPLSNSNQLKKTHGARHRAGLGISEDSDALAIIVSEEKNRISAAFSGHLVENIELNTLRSLLLAFNDNILKEKWNFIFKKKTGSSKKNKKSVIDRKRKYENAARLA